MGKWRVWASILDESELEGQKRLLDASGVEYRVGPATEGHQDASSKAYQIEVRA